ncbi:MAG: LysE family translocator [Devosia nanyangense]|uniref:LysE family translocator n=1 Tax=Devosia nanyangense TaxID=1228055 RepID=A0A933NX28_9HYPH|nr:LysE family translocator [Devosia nanyangense]
MDATLFAAFIAVAIPAFFTPGPNNLMLMASGAKFGFGRTIPHGLGVSIGFALMVVVIGLGLGEVFEALPWLKTALKVVAAIYLLYLAWSLLGLKIDDEATANDRPMTFLQAAAFQWVNPKAWAMAVSFVALVVDPGPGRLIGIALLGLGCLLLGPFSSALWMGFGDRLQIFLKRTGGERFLGIVLAVLVVASVVLFLL